MYKRALRGVAYIRLIIPIGRIMVPHGLFTMVAGILAGFISGRASASGGTRPSG
jgi:hypothetical protein